MAKALFGQVGITNDQRLMAEIRRLNLRVKELEADLAQAKAMNETLAAHVHVGDDVLTLQGEPALA